MKLLKIAVISINSLMYPLCASGDESTSRDEPRSIRVTYKPLGIESDAFNRLVPSGESTVNLAAVEDLAMTSDDWAAITFMLRSAQTQQDQNRLFDKFYQNMRDRRNFTGLGLLGNFIELELYRNPHLNSKALEILKIAYENKTEISDPRLREDLTFNLAVKHLMEFIRSGEASDGLRSLNLIRTIPNGTDPNAYHEWVQAMSNAIRQNTPNSSLQSDFVSTLTDFKSRNIAWASDKLLWLVVRSNLNLTESQRQ